MALINKFSAPSIRGEVDLFSLPATDTTIESSFYAEYKPVVNIQDSDAKIDFRIIGNSSQYLDLFDHFCYFKIKIQDKDSKDIAISEDISTTNNLFHSMFSNCDVSISNQLASTSNNCYMYKAYLETLLTYGKEYLESQGTSAMFYADTDNGSCSNTNSGYYKRKEHVKGSTTVELIDKLKFDLSNQHRYILNNTSITISLTRVSEKFSLIYNKLSAEGATDLEPKIKILDASLFVRKHVLYPSIALSHQKLLEEGVTAKYPFKKSDVKFFSIPQSNQSFIEENMFLGSIPSRVVICFVSNKAFNGDYTMNPLVFKNFGINYLSLCINNVPVPIRGMTLDFPNNQCLLPYYLMFSTLGMSGSDQGLSFAREDYAKHLTIFAFDINQTAVAESMMHLEKTGSVRLEVRFATGLTEAVTCLVYSEHQSVLEIDKFRQIQIY
jgi:hypothetical protein